MLMSLPDRNGENYSRQNPFNRGEFRPIYINEEVNPHIKKLLRKTPKHPFFAKREESRLRQDEKDKQKFVDHILHKLVQHLDTLKLFMQGHDGMSPEEIDKAIRQVNKYKNFG